MIDDHNHATGRHHDTTKLCAKSMAEEETLTRPLTCSIRAYQSCNNDDDTPR